MIRLIVSTAAAVLMIAPAVLAEDKTDPKATPKSAETDRRQKILDKYDTDKDGRLDERERQALRADNLKNRRSQRKAKPNPRTARLLQLFDKNRDGKLDETEKGAARKAILKQRQQMMKRLQQQMRRGGKGRNRGRGARGRRGGGRRGIRRGGGGRRGGGNNMLRRFQQIRQRFLKQLRQRQEKSKRR